MTYRRATHSDLPGIIRIFEICLRESGNPPSLDFWKWKHIQNPFGESPVLLALHNEEIVGLRAFMPWHWTLNNVVYQSFRAVDTATHPNWQRKGIFSRLTKQLLEELWNVNEKVFIFNTPNEKSKPGYLKMGWIVLGKPFVNAFYFPGFAFNERFYRKCEQTLEKINFDDFTEWKPPAGLISTNISAQYYKWRYQDIPTRKYAAWISEGKESVVFVFYMRKRRGFRELRVADYIPVNGTLSNQGRIRAFRALARKFGGSVITTIWDQDTMANSVIRKMVPDVTIRLPENSTTNLPGFSDINNWSFTMGALELF